MSEWNAQQIIDKVYLGSFMASLNCNEMKSHNITHILSLCHDIKEPKYPKVFQYMIVRMEDRTSENLLSILQVCFNFIEEGIQSGGILVHW